MGINHMGAGQLGATQSEFSSGLQGLQMEPSQAVDSMDAYFECITTCSLDDGACVTRCVEQLREQS
ncbi:MAG: hypothetical protein VKK05_06900 [Synechococcus sp.]|jgi:hypothetical protein|nr:hypothetical protein [Synechococcus sp.]